MASLSPVGQACVRGVRQSAGHLDGLEVDLAVVREDGAALVAVVAGRARRDAGGLDGRAFLLPVDVVGEVVLPAEGGEAGDVLGEDLGGVALVVASDNEDAGAEVMGGEAGDGIELFGGAFEGFGGRGGGG